MHPTETVPFRDPKTGENTDLELRLGTSSWDDDTYSVKFTWWDKRHHAARGGEIPMDALPQMLEFAIREGDLELAPAPANTNE